MPRPEEGWQLVATLKAPDSAYRFIPVVLLSAFQTPDDIQTAYETGATAYMVTPTDESELSNGSTAYVTGLQLFIMIY